MMLTTDQNSMLDFRTDPAVIEARKTKDAASARVAKATARRHEVWLWNHSGDETQRIEHQLEWPLADVEWQQAKVAEQKAIQILKEASEAALRRAQPAWGRMYREDWQPVEQALVALRETVRQLAATHAAANAAGVRLAEFGLSVDMLESYRAYFRRDLGLRDDES